MSAERTIVTVRIAGEEYNLRALASPEYTRECAAYVDRTIADVTRAAALVQAHKAPILAALAITDELFQARQELAALRAEITRRADSLTVAIEERLAPADLAAGS